MQTKESGTDSHILIRMETISEKRFWFQERTHPPFSSLGFILNIARDSPHAFPSLFLLAFS